VHNNGADHKRKLGSKDSNVIRKWIIDNNYPPDFQILCYNCNCAKGVYGYCPHQINPAKVPTEPQQSNKPD
jgi:hypothetical protein